MAEAWTLNVLQDVVQKAFSTDLITDRSVFLQAAFTPLAQGASGQVADVKKIVDAASGAYSVPLPGTVMYQSGGNGLDKLFLDILRNSTAVTPDLNPESRQRLQELQNQLIDIEASLKEIKKKIAEDPDEPNYKKQKDVIDRSYNKLLADIDYYKGNNSTQYIQGVYEQLSKLTDNGNKSAPTEYIPDLVDVVRYTTKYTNRFTTFEKTYSCSQLNQSNSFSQKLGDVKVNTFGFNLETSASQTTKTANLFEYFENCTVKVDFMNIQIIRDWDRINEILGLTKVACQIYDVGGVCSGGPFKTLKGSLPLVVRNCLIAQNISITFGKRTNTAKSFFDEKNFEATTRFKSCTTDVSSRVKFSNVDQSSSSDSTKYSLGLKIDGLCVLGYQCSINPMFPSVKPANPNLLLTRALRSSVPPKVQDKYETLDTDVQQKLTMAALESSHFNQYTCPESGEITYSRGVYFFIVAKDREHIQVTRQESGLHAHYRVGWDRCMRYIHRALK